MTAHTQQNEVKFVTETKSGSMLIGQPTNLNAETRKLQICKQAASQANKIKVQMKKAVEASAHQHNSMT